MSTPISLTRRFLKEAAIQADINRDGRLASQEVTQADLPALEKNALSQTLAIAAEPEGSQRVVNVQRSIDTLCDLFEHCDENRDGQLSESELKAAKAFGDRPRLRKLNELVSRIAAPAPSPRIIPFGIDRNEASVVTLRDRNTGQVLPNAQDAFWFQVGLNEVVIKDAFNGQLPPNLSVSALLPSRDSGPWKVVELVRDDFISASWGGLEPSFVASAGDDAGIDRQKAVESGVAYGLKSDGKPIAWFQEFGNNFPFRDRGEALVPPLI